MTSESSYRFGTALLVTANLTLLAAALLAWARVPSNPAEIRLFSAGNSLLLLTACGFYLLLVLVAIYNLVGRKVAPIRRWAGAFLLMLLIVVGHWFQLYSELGVFALGGARYWVHRAAEAKTRDEAKAALKVVLSATQYGTNAAENEVIRKYSPEEQRHLFLLLSEVANNERWKMRYLERAQQVSDHR